MTTAAVIPAAGSSTRLGQPKQLVDFRGCPLVAHAVTLADRSGCAPIIVVTGAEAAAVEAAISSTTAQAIHNDRWKLGMGESIATGARHLLTINPVPDAILIQLCDQPLITPAHLRALLDALATGDVEVAATRYPDGSLGVPACFSSHRFEDLAELQGETGAKAMIREADALAIDCKEAAFDLDHPGDRKSIPGLDSNL